MGRLKELRKYVEHELNMMEDADRRNRDEYYLFCDIPS